MRSLIGRLTAGIGLAAIISSAAFAAEEVPTPPQKPAWEKGMVALTFGNNYKSQFVNALPIMEANKLTGTIYITVADVAPATDDVAFTQSWEEINKWVEAGWDVGSSTFSGTDLRAMTTEQRELEFAKSAALIAKNTGHYPTTFASPNGWFSDDILRESSRYYSGHVTTVDLNLEIPKAGYNNATANRYEISRILVTRDVNAMSVCDDMSWAAKKNLGLVVAFNQVVPEPASGDSGYYQVSTASLEEIAKCANALVRSKEIKLVSVADLVKLLPPQAFDATAALAVAATEPVPVQ